jgi:hypothetical protein
MTGGPNVGNQAEVAQIVVHTWPSAIVTVSGGVVWRGPETIRVFRAVIDEPKTYTVRCLMDHHIDIKLRPGQTAFFRFGKDGASVSIRPHEANHQDATLILQPR